MSSTATPADEPYVQLERADGVCTLWLNRPRQFNPLSDAMMGALEEAIADIAADSSIRCVVIAARGKAFCAGHDLREMRSQYRKDYYQTLFARCAALMQSIVALPVPVIARVHGVATAAGCQLVATCDLAVAAEEARFAVSGINVGLFCATPSVALSRNVGAKNAFDMLVTGRFIDAPMAQDWGLVNRVVPAEQLDAAVDALVNAILAKPREAIAAGKELFYRQSELGIEAAYQLAGQTMACNMMLDVAQEGVQAFIDKRAPTWRTPPR